MVQASLADMPQSTQDQVKANILINSSQFLADMKADLEQASLYLNQTNLTAALNLLDEATRKEKDWEEQVVMPRILAVRALDVMEIAGRVLAEFGDSLKQDVKDNLIARLNDLKAAFGTSQTDLQPLIQALTSLLKELKDQQGPKPTLQIQIECGSEATVGQSVECTSWYDGTPDSVTWLATGGLPSTGNADSFQTSFASEGTYLVSLKACMGSICVEDAQTINVTSQKAEEQESTFSVEIECGSQIEVGAPIGCSFKHIGTPDTVTWLASGGQPSSGSGDSFQTTFGAEGQYSIALDACQASNCISDAQTINVVEPEQSSSGE